MNSGWLFLFMALGATALGQLVYKRACVVASRRMTAIAIVIFCVAPISSFLALNFLSLATVYVSTAISQVIVVLASISFFGERYSSRQWVALCLILAGVFIFNSNAFL